MERISIDYIVPKGRIAVIAYIDGTPNVVAELGRTDAEALTSVDIAADLACHLADSGKTGFAIFIADQGWTIEGGGTVLTRAVFDAREGAYSVTCFLLTEWDGAKRVPKAANHG